MRLLLIIVSLTAILPKCQAEWFLGAELSHVSSPVIRENGYGLNALFANLTYRDKGFFITGSLGVHNESQDCPEVCFGDNFLGRLRVGYEFKLF